MNELTPDSLERALDRAEEQAKMTAELTSAVPRAIDRAFLGHLIVAHGVDVASALERDVDVWRDFHRLMPHKDHSHG